MRTPVISEHAGRPLVGRHSAALVCTADALSRAAAGVDGVAQPVKSRTRGLKRPRGRGPWQRFGPARMELVGLGNCRPQKDPPTLGPNSTHVTTAWRSQKLLGVAWGAHGVVFTSHPPRTPPDAPGRPLGSAPRTPRCTPVDVSWPTGNRLNVLLTHGECFEWTTTCLLVVNEERNRKKMRRLVSCSTNEVRRSAP